jgi:hypothetical protein
MHFVPPCEALDFMESLEFPGHRAAFLGAQQILNDEVALFVEFSHLLTRKRVANSQLPHRLFGVHDVASPLAFNKISAKRLAKRFDDVL